MPNTINKFKADHSFLSNFSPPAVTLDGQEFPTVEHAFQAAKTTDMEQREKIRSASTPGQAKKIGRKVTLRQDWKSVKLDVMRALLIQKFTQPDLQQRLLATGDAELVEGNHWHDSFWGVCRCEKCQDGKNMLGKLLMEVRDSIRKEQA